MADYSMLPQEVAELLQQHEQEKIVKLEQFSQLVTKKRDEAVTARASSGVEQIWLEDGEHYNSVDNANRGRSVGMKPMHPGAGMNSRKKGGTNRSTIFLNVTRPYVDAIVARTCDILLPTDDRNWSLRPTPIPALIKAMKEQAPAAPQPMPPGQPGQPPQPTIADMAMKIMAQAREQAEKAELRIDDWLAESGYNAEVRKVIFDSACLGTGVLKGPFPDKSKSIAVDRSQGTVAISMALETKPRSKRIDPWNFFPDAACGESIHEGNHVFERDYLTAKTLRELGELDGYVKGTIKSIIEEGPKGTDKGAGTNNPNARVSEKDLYEVWYGYLVVGKEDLEAAGVDVKDLQADTVHAIVTLVNDKVIKAVVNPLDRGVFPYDVMAWQRVAGQWAGMGVSRQIRASQQAINAAHRNMLDNAGLSGGPMLIIRQNMIVPADGDWSLSPRKIFFATADADIRGVQDAIYAVNIPSMQAELLNIIGFELKTAEQITGFPLLMAGSFNPQSAPDTYGGQVLATNNSSTVLRHIARVFDDSVTVRHIGRYYEYLLMYGDDESEKGDYQVIARGSTALVEREIQTQEQLQLLQMCGNPAFGLDPKKVMAEWFKSRRFVPERFQYSPEELAQQSKQQQPPPPPVQVAQIKAEAEVKAAQIRAEGQVNVVKTEAQLEIEAAQAGHLSPQMAAAQAAIASAKIRAESELAKEQSRSQTELAYAESQSRMAQVNDLANMRELEMKERIALLKYASDQKISLEQVKADLAKTAIQARTQKELAAAKMAMDAQKNGTDRAHDADKHVSNIISNQETAAAARQHASDEQDKAHANAMALKAKELDALQAKVRDVPGKRQ